MSVCIDQHQHNQSACLAPYNENNKDWIKRPHKTIQLWFARSMQRKALSRLDEHLLNDIGITAEQAAEEINKPFWK